MARKRTKNEVFTQQWTANRMLEDTSTWAYDTYLEPTAGDGNFLVAILNAKLNQNILTNKLHLKWHCLQTLATIYGIELFSDNVKVARHRMLKVVKDYYLKYNNSIDKSFIDSCKRIINFNIVQGNYLTGFNNKHNAIKLRSYYYNKSRNIVKLKHQTMFFNAKNQQNISKKHHFKPDVIIGNPPYDIRNHTKNNISYSQIFQYFAEQAINTNPQTVSLILPNRWFSGGKNLSKFRKFMLNNKHIRDINIWNNSKDLFPNASINGGVSYFVWNKDYDNSNWGIYVSIYHGKKRVSYARRPLKLPNTNVFIEDNIGAKIVQHLANYVYFDHNINLNTINLGKHCSVSCPFTLRPYYPKRSKNWLPNTSKNQHNSKLLKCYAGNHKIGYVAKSVINNRLQEKPSKRRYKSLISQYKLITPGANGIGISKNDSINLILAEPNSICTETYIILGWDLNLNKTELNNLAKYIKTKFVRFLISLHKSSQHAVRKVYNLVPLIDVSNKSSINWSTSEQNIDKQLFKNFNLSKPEIKHIENTIHIQY